MGQGVNIAGIINADAIRSTLSHQQYYESDIQYIHTINVIIEQNEGNIARESEAMWESENIDILTSISTPLKLIMSQLPFDSTIIQYVPPIKISSVNNYLNLNCKKQKFTCPAIPYTISFSTDVSANSNAIKHSYALEAYIDLIENSEFALPMGNIDDWLNPLNEKIWKELTIGGKYKIGDVSKPVNAIIKLYGTDTGYIVDECNIVNDSEFNKFETNLSNWKNSVKTFFDFYVK